MPGIPPDASNIVKDLVRSILGRKKKNRQSVLPPKAETPAATPADASTGTAAAVATVESTAPTVAANHDAPLAAPPATTSTTEPAPKPAVEPVGTDATTVKEATPISDEVVKDAIVRTTAEEGGVVRRVSLYKPTSAGPPAVAPVAAAPVTA